MADVMCPGLPGSWLNGWLAGLGATVLDARIRLHWSDRGTRFAVLSSPREDPLSILSKSWPDPEAVADLPIARRWRSVVPMGRRVTVDVFRQRAAAARGHRQSWALSSTLTDLAVEKTEVLHARFDPPVPKGLTLHDRLFPVHRRATSSPQALSDALSGLSKRIKANGLGFDQTRVGSLADDTSTYVDPIIETLAFYGLALLPVRGMGRDAMLGHRWVRSVQRAWHGRTGQKERFRWPAWQQPLDRFGIDALLDLWNPTKRRDWPRLGVHAGWQTVEYRRRGSADSTRAFGAEPL